ncbi:MAG: CBS domain-containing protein, partial [Zestosphaera sp.]
MKVRSFTQVNYPKISSDTPLTRARAIMRDLSLRLLPVVREGDFLEGILRREHVLSISSTKSDITVSQVAENPPVVFKVGEDARRVFEIMLEFDEWYVPVINEDTGKYVGILSIDSFLRAMLAKNVKAHEKQISEIMTTRVEYVVPEDYVS